MKVVSFPADDRHGRVRRATLITGDGERISPVRIAPGGYVLGRPIDIGRLRRPASATAFDARNVTDAEPFVEADDNR
jgi:hypothetical protein